MINEEGAPSVVEYNVRFGDPETQVTIPLIESDLAELLLATAEGRLSSIQPKFSNKSAVTVVLASKGYPSKSFTGRSIKGAESRIEEGEIKAFVHHAGRYWSCSRCRASCWTNYASCWKWVIFFVRKAHRGI